MNQADLQSIVDFAPDPILVADSQDRWAYVNEAGCRLLGRSRTDIVGRRVAEFLSADDHRRLPEWKTRMQRGETCIGEWSLRCREDVWLPVEVRTRMIGAGRWQAFVRDVSARKAREREQAKLLAENEAQRHRLQAALRTALRERGELLASVSQGLRSPLAELVLSADALEPLTADQEGGGAARAAAVSISESAERLARLTDDLMDVGLAVAAASSMLTLESVPASILLAKARKRFDPLTVEKGLNVTLDANIELPRVDVDQDRILRVLETLLGIAAQHTPEGGHITVSAEHGADGVLFAVTHSGAPLPKGLLDPLLQPFWKANRDPSAAGRALSVCRYIVEEHGGSMWSEPRDGRYVRIVFALPSRSGPADTVRFRS